MIARLIARKAAPYVAGGIGILLLIGAILWLRADAYSDGERANEAKWVAASQKLEREALAAERKANRDKAIRDAAAGKEQSDIQESVDAKKTDDIVGDGVSEYFSRLQSIKDGSSDKAAD